MFETVWRGLCLIAWCGLVQGWPGYAASFRDLAESSFPEAVRVVARAGLLSGYPDGTFRPSGQVTRAELVVTALRLGGAPVADDATDSVVPGSSCFEDVDSRAWYAGAVCRAREQGLVRGVTETRFAPETAVTAAQALKVVLLAKGLSAETLGTETLGTPWYTPYLQRAATLGLSLPAEPNAPLTRAELAQLLFSLLRAEAVARAEPLPSSGCSGASAPPETVTVRGVERTLVVSVPEDTPSPAGSTVPRQLVFAFHGRTGTNVQVRRYYRLEPAPDTVFVYPNGSAPDAGANWTDPAGEPDYALFDHLLELFARETCVDLTHVFVVGHSLGASFANSLGCARGDRVRGVGSLGGGISVGRCRGKVAALVFHNPADRLVPFSEGERVRDRFLAQNGLEASAVPTEPSAFNCERYGGADKHFPVVWCPHRFDYAYDGTYYPHNWPRGTGRVMMDFFSGL